MGMSSADKSNKIWQNLSISNPKPDLHNINAHTKSGENPLMFTHHLETKHWWTYDWWTDTDNQRETIILRHFLWRVGGIKSKKKQTKKHTHKKNLSLMTISEKVSKGLKHSTNNDWQAVTGLYLKTWTICFTSDHCTWDIRICKFIFQVHNIGHTSWEKQLISLWCLSFKQWPVYISTHLCFKLHFFFWILFFFLFFWCLSDNLLHFLLILSLLARDLSTYFLQ